MRRVNRRGEEIGPERDRKAYHALPFKERKALLRNREAWPKFRERAGIDPRLTYTSAWEKSGLNHTTVAYWINGLGDPRLTSAIQFCERVGCTLDGFARAMAEAWEEQGRRYRLELALKAAEREEIA